MGQPACITSRAARSPAHAGASTTSTGSRARRTPRSGGPRSDPPGALPGPRRSGTAARTPAPGRVPTRARWRTAPGRTTSQAAALSWTRCYLLARQSNQLVVVFEDRRRLAHSAAVAAPGGSLPACGAMSVSLDRRQAQWLSGGLRTAGRTPQRGPPNRPVHVHRPSVSAHPSNIQTSYSEYPAGDQVGS